MRPDTRPDAPAAILGAERSGRRDLAHTAALTLPWALIAGLWWRVLRAGGPAVLGRPGAFVGLCAVLTVALTAAWIAHNVAIHRAKGARTGLPGVALAYEQDWTGRPVVADWGAVRHAGVVFVAGAGLHKTFVPARGSGCEPMGLRPTLPAPAGAQAAVA